MKVEKIEIGRLYNLGSYEHISYKLTVAIADGESAATAITGMEKILAGLAPLGNAGLATNSEIAQKKNEIEKMKTMPLADWEQRYGHYAATAVELIERYEGSLQGAIEKRTAAVARAQKARALFDDLGGAAQWKDAKLDWDDEGFL